MDAFALLELPRRPWLSPDTVKAAFQSRARELHPDRAAGDAAAFARLNAAYRALEAPASRLKCLLGNDDIRSAPPDFTLGFSVGAILQECDAFLARRGQARRALDRALLGGEAAAARRKLEKISVEVAAAVSAAEDRLRELDAIWPEVAMTDLAALAGTFTFLERWTAQLRERALALAIGWDSSHA